MLDSSVRISIRLEKVLIALAAVVGVLVLANVGVNVIKLITGDRDFYGLIPLFEFKSERNVPTFFSGCMFLLNAGLFGVVWFLARRRDVSQHVWLFFSLIFVFLAFDEMFQVHERLIDPVRSNLDVSGLFYFGWFLVYGLGVAVIAAIFVPVWWRLDDNIRWLFAVSAATYLVGAIGFEMIGGAVYEATNDEGGPFYAVLYTIEETLEMVGLITLTYTLLQLIARNTRNLQLVLTPPGMTIHPPPLPADLRQPVGQLANLQPIEGA